MKRFRYEVKSITGEILAEHSAEADLMIREIVDIDIEEIKNEKNIFTIIKNLIREKTKKEN